MSEEELYNGVDARTGAYLPAWDDREILQRQFLAMEKAIAGFQSQSSALSQISLIG